MLCIFPLVWTLLPAFAFLVLVLDLSLVPGTLNFFTSRYEYGILAHAAAQDAAEHGLQRERQHGVDVYRLHLNIHLPPHKLECPTKHVGVYKHNNKRRLPYEHDPFRIRIELFFVRIARVRCGV